MKIAQTVYDFLLKLDHKQEVTSIISVDKSGTIQYCNLHNGSPFVISPTPGISIEEFFPGAKSFSTNDRNIYLPNLQTLPNKFFDIHIVPDTILTWFIFINVTEKALKEQEKIEAYNIERLESSVTKQPVADIALLELEVLLLKHTSNKKFQIISKIPEWFKKNYTNLKENNAIEIDEVFPYLENYFQQYLDNNNPTGKKLNSGYWLQQVNNQGSIYLQAFGFRILAVDYLLIYPSDYNEDNKRQDLIQKARENVLAYEKLEKQDKQLKKLLKFKEQFAAVVSHDFRTPLVGLSDTIKMLMEDESFTKNINKEHIELLVLMSEELDLLSDYNNKIYNWSKVENENFELDIQSISIKVLVTEVVRKFSFKLLDKKIELTTEIEEEPHIKGDHLLLLQALSNLVENAIKFSEPNSHINIKTTKNSILVQDHGIGMSEEIRDALFGNLQNVSRPGTNGEKGTGLGLNIVKKIISSHGFQIDLKSKQNEGSTFEILF